VVTRKIILFFIFIGLIFLPSSVFAYVSGPCSNCHTMHASQTPWPDEWSPEVEGNPQPYLLATMGSSPCVGCHSSSSSSTYYTLGTLKVPVVYYTGSAAPTSYLAGGNFWWVKEGKGGDDTKGHNVFYNEGDDYLSKAPGDLGFSNCSTNGCHANLHLPATGTGFPELENKYGCQGCHLNVKHHAKDHPNGESGLVTSADQGWYRFLSGHMSGNGHGVEGYEHGEWEAGLHDGGDHQGASDHNEYLGVPDTDGGYGFALGHTTTAFCTGCHGVFHDYQYDNGWIRHPSDAVIPNEREYQYVGGASHLYDPLSPVGKQDISDATPDTTVTPGSDVVMCLSCHRPHGSPYPDLLRWDYTEQIAGGGGNDKGCFYCHTQKND